MGLAISSAPWTCGEPLTAADHHALMRRSMFECFKWHTHVEDVPILCPFPLILQPGVWQYLARAAESLAKEALLAEQELLRRPELHQCLGLPVALRRTLGSVVAPSPGVARFMRFDFHWTIQGWRISEGNIDVAGGFIESSGVTRLAAAHYPGCAPTGDPAGAWADAMLRCCGPGARVALMHLTVYSEDRQIMLYLARQLEECSLIPCLVGPRQLSWDNAIAHADGDALDAIFRFFPAEWMPRLRTRAWQYLLVDGRTPICNPAYAVLTQSKRFALAWDRLATPLPTWRSLLPETVSPDAVDGTPEDWVIKPALGHEGNNVGVASASKVEFRRIHRSALKHPHAWAAQRRFDVVALPTPEGPLYPSLGVYVVDGRAAGAYARVSLRPLIDDRSREIVVLVRN